MPIGASFTIVQPTRPDRLTRLCRMTADASRSTALHTDRYELTMLDAALRDGTADRRCVFELFGRRLPGGRRFGVVARHGAAARA